MLGNGKVTREEGDMQYPKLLEFEEVYLTTHLSLWVLYQPGKYTEVREQTISFIANQAELEDMA